MLKRELILFEEPGPAQTEPTLQAVKARAQQLGIQTVVLATTTGETALRALEALKGTGVQVVGVTLQAGTWATYAPPDPDKVAKARQAGAQILTATHTLMGNVGSAVGAKFGGAVPCELIAHTYYTFCQGMKVAVEVALMAADAGLVPVDRELIAVAGTGEGADTAIVLSPAYSTKFFDLKVREIIAMPR